MNCKFKSFLSVLCGLFAVLFLFNSCETDRPETLQSQQEFVPPAIKARHVRIQELLAQPKLAVKLNKLAVAGLGKSTNLAGIQLDTTGIRAIETDNYISYTFNIVQEASEKQTVLKNYMLTIVNDSIEIQHLVNYNVLSPGVYNMDHILIERVYGDELRVQFNKSGSPIYDLV